MGVDESYRNFSEGCTFRRALIYDTKLFGFSQSGSMPFVKSKIVFVLLCHRGIARCFEQIKGGRVVDERRTLSPIAPTPCVAPNLAATILLVAEAVGNLSFSLPKLSAAPISTTTVTSEDDSPSFPDAVVVRSDFLSTIFIVEVEDDSFFIPSEIIISSSIDVCHQDKGKRVVIGDEERVVPKSSFEEEDVGVDSRGSRKFGWLPYKKLLDQFQLHLLWHRPYYRSVCLGEACQHQVFSGRIGLGDLGKIVASFCNGGGLRP
ncbi:hypothetical protein Adt_35149 [Abeliophyllum distichum]|uniref:Uncharacterized protein n=1 Tax=Abeliophyllum distichum TaxID=126358 RepID=A0ABD1QFP6_9LAMI